MSSGNKKTFKTSDTTKAVDATVVSDTISLDPTTTDHVLTVTANSNANITGDVDVELEMSPDGEHWCPVQYKQTSAGTTTSGTDVEGNEKFVGLSSTGTGTDYKNKFARGRKTYDLNTNQQYSGNIEIPEEDRTETVDFMHHMIAVNKAFNYSGWYKTSEQPSTTYNPVIFRHGGHDPFENLKAVELTDTGTQNLCNDTEGNNFKYITAQDGSHTAAEPCWQLTGTDANLFSLSGNSMISISDAWSVSMKVDFPRTNNTSTKYLTFFSMFTDVSASGSGIQIIHKRESTSSDWQKMRIGISDGSRYWYRDYTLSNPTNEFGHLVVVKNAGGFSSSTDPFTVYWENSDRSSTGGTISQSNSTSLSWSGLSVDEVHLAGFHKYFTANNQLGKDTGLRKIDNVACYPFALTSAQVNSLYNSSSYYDPNLIAGATAIFRMGDGPNDSVANNEIFDTKITTTTRKFVKGATTNSDTIVDLLTTDNIYYLGPPSLNALFTTTSNLSISGWFRTPSGATGTLFSNTGGAAATGLKVDVTGSGITASYTSLSSSDTISVAGDFNDGEWHHIAMLLSPGSQLIVIDNLHSGANNYSLTNDQLRGDNGFTLLSDGQENANNPNASTTDTSKLSASLSNWSLHSEALSTEGIAQLYSNGHVRNIKNLPSVTASAIEAWWKLSDITTPEEDLVGTNDLQYLNFDSASANLKYMNLLRHGDGGVTVTDSNWMLDTTQITSPFYDSSDTSPTQATPSFSNGMSGSFWFKVPWNNLSESGFKYKDLFRIYTSNSKAISLIHTWNNTAGKYQWRLKIGNADGSGSYHATIYDANAFLDGNWHYLTWSVQGTGTAGLVTGTTSNSTSDLKLWIDGNGVDAVTAITSITVNDSYTSGSTVDNVGLGRLHYSGYQEPTHAGNIFLDNIAFYKGPLEDVSASSIYTNRNNPSQATLVPGTKLTALFKGGDGPNDTTTSVESTLSTNNTIKFIQGTTVNSNPGTTASYVGTEAPYVTPVATSITDTVVDATGAVLVEDSINGNAMTLSITKNFNFTTESWVSDASEEATFCLSFNGHEEQAEYFALWKCNQIDENVNFLDGEWHNIVLSYRPAESGENNQVRFGAGEDSQSPKAFRWNLSIDGRELNPINGGLGVDYIGGLGSELLVETMGGVPTNTGFSIYNRHLKYDSTNLEEVYITHAQAGSNITENANANSPHAFQTDIDETSFHSQNFWKSSGGVDTTNFESEYPATIYGNTTGLSVPPTRGAGSPYPTGKPYPLLNPTAIGAIPGSSQYINPNRYHPVDNPDGGLEAWWRWGDTPGDCAENVNDACDYAIASTINDHDLRAQHFNQDEVVGPIPTLQQSRISTGESIYLANQEATTSSGVTTSLVNLVIEGIADTACNFKNIAVPVLQYLRVKFTGSGSIELGEGKTSASIWYKKRRTK